MKLQSSVLKMNASKGNYFEKERQAKTQGNMIYIGIDPGQTGAIAILSDENPIILANRIFDFQDGDSMAWLKTIGDEFMHSKIKAFAVIEKVSAMPKQGVSSTFKFGTNFGRWIGRLEMVGIPFDYVTPAKWKKVIFDSMPRSADQKAMSLDRARRLFPQMANKLKRKKDHNRADALLLAEYCRRIYKP